MTPKPTRADIERTLAEILRGLPPPDDGMGPEPCAGCVSAVLLLRKQLDSGALAEAPVVPREPTEAMLDAAHKVDVTGDVLLFTGDYRELWHAMYDAAPSVPLEPPQPEPRTKHLMGCDIYLERACNCGRVSGTSYIETDAAMRLAATRIESLSRENAHLQELAGQGIHLEREALIRAEKAERENAALQERIKMLQRCQWCRCEEGAEHDPSCASVIVPSLRGRLTEAERERDLYWPYVEAAAHNRMLTVRDAVDAAQMDKERRRRALASAATKGE